MNLSEKTSIFYKLLKKLDVERFKILCEKVDSFVLITEHMKDILKVNKRPYVVVEGVVNNKNYSHEKSKK